MTVGIRRTSVLDGNLLIVLTNGTQLLIAKSTLDSLTEGQISGTIAVWRENEDVGPCGLHRNRVGTYCVWTGEPPDVWPEDVTGTFG